MTLQTERFYPNYSTGRPYGSLFWCPCECHKTEEK